MCAKNICTHFLYTCTKCTQFGDFNPMVAIGIKKAVLKKTAFVLFCIVFRGFSYFNASSTATAQDTEAPTIGLLPTEKSKFYLCKYSLINANLYGENRHIPR